MYPAYFIKFFLFSFRKAAPLGFNRLLQGFTTCEPWINVWLFTAR